MDSETEVVDSDNERVDNTVLPPERKWYSLRNPLGVNYSDKRATRISMVWNNLIFGSDELHSVAKAYINVVNAITSFVKPTPPNSIITNETILNQYSIKQGLKVFEKKGEAEVRKEVQQFHDWWCWFYKRSNSINYTVLQKPISMLLMLLLLL